MVPTVPIAVTMSNGTIAVLIFIRESRSPTLPPGAVWLAANIWRREPTKENIEAEIAKAFPAVNAYGVPQPQPVRWALVAPDAIPQDRTYRNAWRHDGEKIHHDMAHARKIHLELVRQSRLEALGKLDRDWMRATGRGDVAAAQAIENERQKLRDLPTTLPVHEAETPEQLKEMWPKELSR